MRANNQDGCLGANLTGKELENILDKFLETNLLLENSTGKRPTPICIWGTHGLGKTQIAMDIARKRNWKIAYCAPAQFEEMGDLHGLPQKYDPDPNVSGDERTVYMAPDWVPKDEGPGILLLDDINRADDRILRGTMQLLQNFEMFSWSLPKKWQIIATANPDSGDYSVTPMDDAMLTRMMHLTLNFDAKSWAEWAINASIDSRGIDFVLTYPESITGRRTTPRSLEQFFNQIKYINDLNKSIDLVSVIASGCLDEETVGSFIAFIKNSLSKIPNALDILNAEKTSEINSIIKNLANDNNGVKRLDLLSTFSTRIEMELRNPKYNPVENSGNNLIEYLLCDHIPGDLKFSIHRNLSVISNMNLPGSTIAEIACKDSKVAQEVLKML
jgi:MoxR-like ATPase